MCIRDRNVAVLERARFALVGIAHKIFGTRVLLGHETPLEPGREAGAAAAAQSRFLDFGDHRLGRYFLVQNLFQRAIAAARLVVLEVPVRAVQAGHQDSVGTVVEHHFSSASSWSSLSLVMEPHMRLLFTSSTGASPHAPMHSPCVSVMRPSAVVSLKPTPRHCFRCSAASAPPESAHGRLVHTVTLCLPPGARLYLSLI